MDTQDYTLLDVWGYRARQLFDKVRGTNKFLARGTLGIDFPTNLATSIKTPTLIELRTAMEDVDRVNPWLPPNAHPMHATMFRGLLLSDAQGKSIWGHDYDAALPMSCNAMLHFLGDRLGYMELDIRQAGAFERYLERLTREVSAKLPPGTKVRSMIELKRQGTTHISPG